MRKRQKFITIILCGTVSLAVLMLIHTSTLTLRPIDAGNKLFQIVSRLRNSVFNVVASTDPGLANKTVNDPEKKCPDILSGMVKGHWIQRPLTQQEQRTIDDYLHKERGQYNIPPSYQRNDGRCGDLAYEQSPLYPHMWFKSICNPRGSTPCCYTNRCMNLSMADCRCPSCYDERQALHAEYAQWEPDNRQCQVKNFTMSEACTLLNGTTLHFVGDSFIRHVFVATVVILTNNTYNIFKQNTPPYILNTCQGMHQMTFGICRDYLDENRSLCNGNVKVLYTQVFPAKEFMLMPPLLNKLRHIKKSLMVLGFGIHDNFNVTTVAETFLRPFFSLHQALALNGTSDVASSSNLHQIPRTSTNTTTSLYQGKATATHMSLISSAANMSNATFGKAVNDEFVQLLYGNSIRNNDILMDFARQANRMKSSVSALNTPRRQNMTSQYPLVINGTQQIMPEPVLNSAANIINNNSNVSSWQTKLAGTGAVSEKHQEMMDNLGRFHQVDHLNAVNVSRSRRHGDVNTSSLVGLHRMPTHLARAPWWPRLFWIGIHSPGLLKSSTFSAQTHDGVRSFNDNVYHILKQFNVPYLDTFGFTNGTVSFDGTHYGWGVNMLKVNMLLTYIEHELLGDPDWR